MSRLEKWTLPNCSLGNLLRDFFGCLSVVENPRVEASGRRQTPAP